MRRLLSIGLCVMLITALALCGVPVSAADSTYFTLVSDRTEAAPGDAITYTVSIGPVEGLYGLKLKLVIPEGLTYVANSAVISEGLDEKMDAVKVEFTESTMVFIVGACDYTSTSDTILMQFRCTADGNASGSKVVHFEIDPENVFNQEYENIEYTMGSAAVSVVSSCVHEWINTDCTSPKTCQLCGAVDNTVSDHSWSKECAHDENGHWYDCVVCSISKVEAHSDKDEDGVCDVCDYTMSSKPVTTVVIIVIVAVLLVLCAGIILLLKIKRK